MTHPGHEAIPPGAAGAFRVSKTGPGGPSSLGEPSSAFEASPPIESTSQSLLGVPPLRPANDTPADIGQEHIELGLPRTNGAPGLMQPAAASPRSSPRTREDGVEQATLMRRGTDEPRLEEEDLKLLAQIASGVTADVAARKLELSARTLRRRLRAICDRLEVNTPIEAVVWAARRQLI
jgi:DNA-binding CsgD family transcriptional regulator